jgi:hypothetical protein
MSTGGGGGGGGSGCLVKLWLAFMILGALWLGATYGWNHRQDGRVPDVPDRDPCTVRCDRSGNGLDGP